jgi:chorismate mutase
MKDQAIVCSSPGPGTAPGMGSLNTLVGLVFHRLDMAQDVAAIKYRSGQLIDDSIREREIAESAVRALDGSGSRQKAAMQFLRDQVEANKVIQRGLHHRWYAHPEEVPAVYRSLAADIRPELSHTTALMMREFTGMSQVPHVSCGDIRRRAESELAAGRPERQLPGLYRDAALFALRSFIPPTAAVPT